MYNIYFYQDKNGHQLVLEYIQNLKKRNNKDSRIKLNKINDYITILGKFGTRAGEPYIKHIDGEIWELRPLRDRILFVAWHNGDFVLLHQFMKKTQKTPLREIQKAKNEYSDLLERGFDNEKK